ncbi:hypothetical protein VOLCADRAFT_99643 [Volvox carteri f. nagariensis]|uniref:UBX domain-containing protein n=1 Tax=Volvox carteri f. nagariensis TaxID=3068 RepID=D8UI91_VOLCA|nr:uncharacterized protein VOLCADRAFT_99643 [Volvox carteri f. nagariensis]EFJ40523.1 hypothetical protein VOLCADRAFT_99643 [Volvox carteri f. nagariensis]|eukprot:XP_002958373.1 hypothetical protein VOLCADRAFT_99643 [Volvox carteri f. nagariensis]
MADGGYVPDDLAVNRLQMMAHCDEAQARFLLEAAGGNMELALQMAVAVQPAGTGGAAAGGGGGPATLRPRAPGVPRAGGAPALAAPLSLLGFVFRMPLLALGFGFRVVRFTLFNGLHAAAVVGDRVLPVRVMRAARSVAATIAAGTGASGEELDPAGQAAAFVASFKASYGDRHPRWQESGWRVACQQARREFKFLLVYLHSPEHEDTDVFCRTVLTCPDVVNYINAKFVSWGGDVTAADAFVLSQQTQMAVTRFPYVALLSVSPSDVRVQLVASGSGAAINDPQTLLTLLRGAVANFGALLEAQRAEAEVRATARRLVEEQNEEYEASLAADRRREAERAEERRRQEEEEQRRQEEERRAREAAAAEAARQAEAAAAVEQRRQAARAALLPEPPAGSEGSAAIRLRLPDGTNTARCFPRGAALQAVFDFVDSLDATSYSRYHLVANYPRRVFLRAAHGPASLQELGLTPQAALFVQPDE